MAERPWFKPMNSDTWIHLIIFIIVFVFTGTILSRKKKNKENQHSNIEYEEIEAEILEPKDILRQVEDVTANPYETLGVHQNDSWETIDNVYKNLIDIYHPNRDSEATHFSVEQKRELTAQINAAYDWLKKYHKNN